MTDRSALIAEARNRYGASAVQAAAARAQAHREPLGFVPPIGAPGERGGPTAERLKALHGWMRVDVEAAAHFGARLPRLAMLGMPVAEQGPAALPRAAAARRGAASRKGVQAVVDPALLSSELPAAEGGNALLHALTEFERLDQAAGLVAVYS